MGKGKKFDAAQKHFEEKCIEWRQQIRELEWLIKEYTKDIIKLNKELDEVKQENEKLKKDNEALMELKDLSKEDVQILIKTKRFMASVAELTKHFY